jgi:putative glutamine amidotransferase
MSKPLIGISTFRTRNEQNLPYLKLAEAYVQAVILAGGLPVLLPLGLTETDLSDLLDHLDGVLFSGGGDMDPACYGGQPHARVYDVDHERDALEVNLYQDLIRRQTPFLGICRGFQVLNVAMGGTLYEDIADQHEGALQHSTPSSYPRNYLAHSVRIDEASRLAKILGKPMIEVNSLHHQGVRQLAPALLATAYAPDGIIEGMELPGHPFGLAVQWHPEALQEHEPMRAIFHAFIEAARHQPAA